MRALRALPSAFGLTLFLVGVPVALVWWDGWPLPHHWPGVADWETWAQQPDTAAIVTGFAVCLIWICWAVLVLAVAAEIVRLARKARVPALRLPNPVQLLAASLVGSTAVALSAAPALAATVASAPATTPPRAHDLVTLPEHAEDPAAAPALPGGIGILEHQGCGYRYTVKRGDSLWTIAQRCLGHGRDWPSIWRLNEHRFWPAVSGYTRLNDPDVIYPQWTLRLPYHATPPAGAAPLHPHRVPGTAPAAGAIRTPTPTATPTSPAPPDAARAGTPSAVHRGIDLPGGWLPLPLAAAIATAASAYGWRRRGTQSPPLATATTADPDQRPLPRAATLLRRALADQAPALLETRTPPGPTMAAFRADPDPARLPAPGPSGTDLAGLADSIPPDGLGLTGPGAHDAARALLTAALSSGTPADPEACGHVIITADAYATLLPGAPAPADAPRLVVTATHDEAVTAIEEAIIARHRQLEDAGIDETAASDDPYRPPMPQLLLLAHVPPAGGRRRLDASTRLGATVAITTVLLGDWPQGSTTSVATDGSTGDDTRLATLDVATALELLPMLLAAHTDERDDSADTEESTPTGPAHTEGADTTGPPAADPNLPVQLIALGKPTVLDQDGQPVAGMRNQARNLLAYLAAAGGAVPIGDIMAALWPDAQVPQATQRFSTEVGNLRRTIRIAAGTPDIEPVVRTGHRYRLDPAVVDVDIWRITRRLQEASDATDTQMAITALRDAVAADTAPLAADADWDDIDLARDAVRRDGVTARLQLAALVITSDPDNAADLIDQAVATDPYNEETTLRAMRIHVDAGNTNAARELYDRLAAALSDIDTTMTTDAHRRADDLLTG